MRGTAAWVAYCYDGKEIRERAIDLKTKKPTDDINIAAKYLKDRMEAINAEKRGGDAFMTPHVKRLTISDLLSALKAKYEKDGKASAQNLSVVRRAEADFGPRRALALTSKDIEEYKDKRLSDGDAAATINRTLQVLRRAYSLARKRGEIARMPFVEMFPEDNAREGFFEEQQIRNVLANLPDDGLRDFVAWAAETGQRKSEIAGLTWKMIEGDELHIPLNLCKNRKARTIPVGAELREIITRREKARRVVSLDNVTQISEPIFHRGDGHKILEFRKSWKTATKKAGCPGKLFHDLRRSVARRLLAAGVSTQTAKKFGGWKSDSIFERYAIIDAAELLKAQKKVAKFRKAM
jgi:integrase